MNSGTPVVVSFEQSKCEHNKYFEYDKYQPIKKRFFADFVEWCHTHCRNIELDFLKKSEPKFYGVFFN